MAEKNRIDTARTKIPKLTQRKRLEINFTNYYLRTDNTFNSRIILRKKSNYCTEPVCYYRHYVRRKTWRLKEPTANCGWGALSPLNYFLPSACQDGRFHFSPSTYYTNLWLILLARIGSTHDGALRQVLMRAHISATFRLQHTTTDIVSEIWTRTKILLWYTQQMINW